MKMMKWLVVWSAAIVMAAHVAAAADAGGGVAGMTSSWEDPQLVKAFSNEGLAAQAERTSDVKTLLGLEWLSWGATRAAIRERIVRLSPGEAPAAAAIACSAYGQYGKTGEMLPRDIGDVDAFLKVDGDNGVPHCLKAYLLIDEGKTAEAMAELRKGMELEKFKTYDEPQYRRGLVSAIDGMGLAGEARLFAQARVIMGRAYGRWYSIYGTLIRLADNARKAAASMPADESAEASELLARLAGKLAHEGGGLTEGGYSTYMVLRNSCMIRAGAAEDADTKRGYELLSYVAGMVAAHDLNQQDLLTALQVAGGGLKEYGFDSMTYESLDTHGRALVDEAMEKQRQATQRFFAVMEGADGNAVAQKAIVGGLLAANSLMRDSYPAVATAVEEVLSAQEATSSAWEQASSVRQSKNNLKKLGLSMLMYSNDHDGLFPKDLETLRTEGYLMSGVTLESPISGKPYVFAAPGISDSSHPNTVLVYDDSEVTGGFYLVLYVDGHVALTPAEELEAAIKKQSK